MEDKALFTTNDLFDVYYDDEIYLAYNNLTASKPEKIKLVNEDVIDLAQTHYTFKYEQNAIDFIYMNSRVLSLEECINIISSNTDIKEAIKELSELTVTRTLHKIYKP
jgi:hypothetical protein